MAITWRNVDAPQGLNQAAGQVQQSFRDVANSLKDVGQNFVDMKSNDAMAALEARLAQEQQLGNVDPLTQMDAGQLRGATSGWIDTSKAREMIQGRQQVLEQQVVGDFNEAVQAGDLDTASRLEQQLVGRAGDFSVQTGQLQDERYNQALVGNDFDAMRQVARTPQQQEAVRLKELQQSIATNKFDRAEELVTTPEEANLLQKSITNNALRGLGPQISTEFTRISKLEGKDFEDAYSALGKKTVEDILKLPPEAQAAAAQQWSIAQTELAKQYAQQTAIPDSVKERSSRVLSQIPEVIETQLTPMRNELNAQKRLLGNLATNPVVAALAPAALQTAASGDNLKTVIDALNSLEIDAAEFQELTKDMDLGNYTAGTVITAVLAGKIENDYLPDFIGRGTRKENLEARLKKYKAAGIDTINAETIIQNQENDINRLKLDLTNKATDATLTYANKSKGKSTVDSDYLMKFNPFSLVDQAFQGSENVRLTKPTSTTTTTTTTTKADDTAGTTEVREPADPLKAAIQRQSQSNPGFLQGLREGSGASYENASPSDFITQPVGTIIGSTLNTIGRGRRALTQTVSELSEILTTPIGQETRIGNRLKRLTKADKEAAEKQLADIELRRKVLAE